MRQGNVRVILELCDISDNVGGLCSMPLKKTRYKKRSNCSRDFWKRRCLTGCIGLNSFAGMCTCWILLKKGMQVRRGNLLFIEDLKRENRWEDWQIAQAEESVYWFLKYYLGLPEASLKLEVEQAHYREWKDVLNKLQESIRVKHLSMRTEQAYMAWVRRFSLFAADRDMKLVNGALVRDFLSQLALEQRVSASTQNQAYSALLYLFRHVLNLNLDDMASTLRAPDRRKIPVVLAKTEVRQVVEQLEGTQALMVKLLYGTGMRVSECTRLRVKDLDFEASVLTIRGGKGDKDRRTVLPKSLRIGLQGHLARVKALHEMDLKQGYGDVYLPPALARKYSKASRDWIWQYVFPSAKLAVDPRSGAVRRHHVME